jgi:putative membrane protein
MTKNPSAETASAKSQSQTASVTPPSPGLKDDAINVVRGLAMGAADIVPGVSGGTVALILGHYERLIAAISQLNIEFVQLVLARKFSAAIRYADLRFLAGLGVGIAIGIVALASLMHQLLDLHMGYTFAFFCGLILASAILVGQRISRWNIAAALMVGAGAWVAYQICVLEPLDGSLSPLNVFISAAIAICAMILPGISGAFVLLLLGMYHEITGMIKEIAKGQITLDNVTTVAIFCIGCLVGVLVFSRLLKWLLARHGNSTMAFLVGLMLGSLYRIWPFQVATVETAALEFKERRFDLQWPWASDLSMWLVLGLILVGFAGVFLLERIGRRLALAPSLAD